MAGDVLPERGTVDLAPGPAGAPGEAVDLGEQVVGHGHGGLHTRSITRASGRPAAGDSRPCLLAAEPYGPRRSFIWLAMNPAARRGCRR